MQAPKSHMHVPLTRLISKTPATGYFRQQCHDFQHPIDVPKARTIAAMYDCRLLSFVLIIQNVILEQE